MPKSARKRTRSEADTIAESLSDVEIDDVGHTPKWTRSSASASPPPVAVPPVPPQPSQSQTLKPEEMQCILPGHPPLTLASAAEYETHYAKEHTNQCVECKAILPSSWFMELHQMENHDPLIAAKREAGEKTYRCFIEDCDKITLNAQKRRLHLIDKHQYPKNYDFRIVDSGSSGRRTLLREDYQPKPIRQRRRVSEVGKPGWRDSTSTNPSLQPAPGKSSKALESTAQGSISMKTKLSSLPSEPRAEIAADESVDQLNTALSSLSFVPMSVRMKSKKKT